MQRKGREMRHVPELADVVAVLHDLLADGVTLRKRDATRRSNIGSWCGGARGGGDGYAAGTSAEHLFVKRRHISTLRLIACFGLIEALLVFLLLLFDRSEFCAERGGDVAGTSHNECA